MEAHGKNWTEEELYYLQEYWGVKSIKSISESLGRTFHAIKNKAHRIGLEDPRQYSDDILLSDLADAIGFNVSAAYYWIRHNRFPARRKTFAKSRPVYIVNLENFWEWAEAHRDRFDFTRIERNILGKEPAWVGEKRKADALARRKPNNDPWTEAEIKKLLSLIDMQCYSYAAIAERVGRSEESIRYRLYKLGVKGRPVRRPNHTKWTAEEMKVAQRMIHEGYALDTIGREIGKTAQSVRGKMDREGWRRNR